MTQIPDFPGTGSNMNTAALFQFLEVDTAGMDVSDIVAMLDTIVDEAGFEYYTLTRQPKVQSDSDSIVLAGRWPHGWPETYVRRKYSAVDPMIRYLGYCQNGFSWDEAAAAFSEAPQSKRVEKMMAEARRFGLEAGYVFPVHGRQGLAGILSIGGRTATLAPGQVSLMETAARKAYWSIVEPRNPQLETADAARRSPPMTRREMETLGLLAEGFTSNEMGSTLGLSAHTVDWYMNGIQVKLDARNRHHAVAIAFRRGLIS